jgi:hypothetical protein
VSNQEPTAPTQEAPASTEEAAMLAEETAAVSTLEVTDVAEEEFLDRIRSARPHGCVVEEDVPCDLYTAMSAELVEWRRNQWYPTGKIVNNRKRWGVRVRFRYWGNYALCLAGRLKITAWWDGFAYLPEGKRDEYIDVDPCRTPHQYEVVIPITRLRCPQHAGVYDIAATLDFVCCHREAIVLGHCDLEAIRVTC